MRNPMYYMMGHESKYNKVVMIRGMVGDGEIEVGLKCKNCSDFRQYTLMTGKVKTVKCRQCKKEEILVPIYGGDGIIGFRIIGKYQYNKLYNQYKDRDKVISVLNGDIPDNTE